MYRSQIPQRLSTIFPYPDPTKIDNPVFAARLVALAQLECETVQQEVLGSRWPSQSSVHLTNRPSSATTSTTSLHSREAITKGAKKLRPRLRSAKNAQRAKTPEVKVEVGETGGTAQDCSPRTVPVKQASSDLCSPLRAEEESTSDLGVSIESLCVSTCSEEALQMVDVASGQPKEAWQPEVEVGKEETKETRKPKGKGKKIIYKSSSACCLGSHRTVSPKRKKSAKSWKK